MSIIEKICAKFNFEKIQDFFGARPLVSFTRVEWKLATDGF